MKKTDKAEELLNDINHVLNGKIADNERLILLSAKSELEKKAYLPKIVKNLETKLSLLAIQKKLSENGGQLYLKITSSAYKDKGFGQGLFTVFGINKF